MEKTINANSYKEEALSIVEAQLAKLEAGMQNAFRPAMQLAA